MTSLPDWLVERHALGEVPPASKARIDNADPAELAERVAALTAENAAELDKHPAGPAVGQIEARVRRAKADRAAQRRRVFVGVASAVAAAAVVVVLVVPRNGASVVPADPDTAASGAPTERVKGIPELKAFRRAGDKAEELDGGALVRAGDRIQLRYRGGNHSHGVIASVDGAGVVTLHYPMREDAPPEATALATGAASLPNSYELDDAPRFERFFFITGNGPIDVQQSLAALRVFAQHADCDKAQLELPGLDVTSLLLRKPTKVPTP